MEGIANSKLRRLFAYIISVDCADVKVSSTALFYDAHYSRGAHRRQGPDVNPDYDFAAATAKFRSQTFDAARFREQREVDARDVEGADRNPASGNSDTMDGTPSVELAKTSADDRFF